MRFGSVCSGIEAASVAWKPLGWEAAWLAEIEPFPSAVLKHHYPDVPNYGDMTKFKDWPDEPIDLLCGGTPCQSFSVAGLRKGLDDPRGNLMLTYLAIAAKYRPKWLVWENVPGVLSSNSGRDFASFLHGMGECGYGFAYRVLDAQYFGVAQRRRRVFVVGCLGDWRSAAAVLFEQSGLLGNPAPSRKTRQEITGTIEASLGRSRGAGTPVSGVVVPDVVACMSSGQANAEIRTDGGATALTCLHEAPIVAHPIAFSGQMSNPQVDFDMTPTLGAKNPMAVCTQYGEIAGSLTARHDSSPCADRGMNVIAHTVPTLVSNGDAHSGFRDEHGLVPVAFPIDTQNMTEGHSSGGKGFGEADDPSFTLTKGHSHAVAFGVGESPEVGHCLRSGASKADKHESTTYVAAQMAVRRLTPTECERLQGFPDGYTNIPWRGKPEAPDGPRYKALGNSWAVPCARWIGERIMQVEKIK